MKFLSVVGARPQFVKLAPLHRELVKRHEHVIVHTGQHYDYRMSQVFFEELNIPDPQHNLGVGSGNHGEQTGKMLVAIESVLQQERPDCVIVYGDTNTTLAAALAATKLLMPVAHVEAGLRSFRKGMPEEINRVLTDHISTLLFCPSEIAVKNLANEGIRSGVHIVGDTMTHVLMEIDHRLIESIPARFRARPGEYLLVTIHRQENADSKKNMSSIIEALRRYEGTVILPMHPRTAKNLRAWGMMEMLENAPNIKLLEPLSFLDFTAMEKFANHIMTDSGGVQKEAYYFQVPCTTVRDETEWLETLEGRWNVLTGADTDKILASIHRPRPSHERFSYGDGDVCKRIVACLENEIR